MSPSDRPRGDGAERRERRDAAGRAPDRRPRARPGPRVDAGMEALRRLLAEFLGTFALTLVAAGGEVIAEVSGGEVDHVARMLAPGLLVMAFVYGLGDASGAHFNPAVTLAFALRRVFPLRWVAAYWVAQVAGALVAALLLLALFGNVHQLGATQPHHGTVAALAFEIVLTWMLVTVILGTADRYRLVGPNAAIAVGATIALCGLFSSPVSGASMNPARSLGPALLSGATGDAWIYVLGPVAGALLAVGSAYILHGPSDRNSDAQEAASGEPEKARPG